MRGAALLTAAKATVVGAALAAAFVPLPAAFVEGTYARTIYPAWQTAITSASNTVPVALFDVLIAAVVLAWIALAARDLARQRPGIPGSLRILTRTIVWGATVYLLFLASWGLNYQRVPLADRLALDRARVQPADVRTLATHAAAQLNALHGPAHATGWTFDGDVDARLASALADVQRDLGATHVAAAARPKRTLLDPYFRRAVVDGMTDPFFLETLVVADLLPFERPFVTAHEWAHLAGFAHEGEANFVGWLACMRGNEAQQYSGWLFLYNEAAGTVPRENRAALAARLDPGPLVDLRAVAARVARNASPRVAAAGWRVYDQYLKSNGIESGTASYTEVIRLILGTRFRPI